MTLDPSESRFGAPILPMGCRCGRLLFPSICGGDVGRDHPNEQMSFKANGICLWNTLSDFRASL